MAEFDWQLDQLMELIPIFCTIFFSEFFIDWVKHAFVLKFNYMSAQVFNEFKVILANEMFDTKKKQVKRLLFFKYYLQANVTILTKISNKIE